MKKENEKLEARVEALEKRVRTLEAMFNSLTAVSALAAGAEEVDSLMAVSVLAAGAEQKSLIGNSPSPKGSLPSRAASAGSTLPSEQCFAAACPLGQKAHPCGGRELAGVATGNGLNAKAWELMEKARKEEYLDEHFMPLCSRTTLALLASLISMETWGERRWKPFEALWGVKKLSTYFNHAMTLYKFTTVQPTLYDKMGIVLPSPKH